MALTAMVASLGSFFQIHVMLVCLGSGLTPLWDEVDVLAYPWQWHLALLETRDLSSQIHASIKEGPVMVICSGEELEAGEWTKTDFGSRFVWLVEENQEIEGVSSKLPLTLESNLLAFAVDDMSANISISELYSIKSSTKRKTYFGYWNLQEGLVVPEPVIWERRSDLSGVTLINTVLEWQPLITLGSNNDTSGFFPDILSYIQAHLNYR